MTQNKHPHSITRKCRPSSVGVDSIPLSSETLKRIEEAKEDLKTGNVWTLKELKEKYGLE
ncbi:hypothetical protein Mpsy_3001 [Methanolobus psychrophilus R15]|nr:hypothetical protein Mpsy_3001 [Methanolobus psychrophilus R15]